jgi:hypothetical protein
MKRLSIMAAVALSVSFGALSSPAHSATLRIGLGEDTDTLDPAQGRTFGGRQMFAALCDNFSISTRTPRSSASSSPIGPFRRTG